MISRVRGTLVRREPGVAEVQTAGGVGYEVEIPLGVYERLPREGGEVELRTLQVVREDAVALYGFLESGERAMFARLLTASGVGPRLALNMLSTMAPERLARAILEKDIAALRQIPGLGTKKAERLVLELGDRLGDIGVERGGPAEPRGREAAVSALIALGFPALDASAAVRQSLDEAGSLTGADLIKAALGRLSGGRPG
jgi:Holliday junction DNA helicase RuvA